MLYKKKNGSTSYKKKVVELEKSTGPVLGAIDDYQVR
jgi:hypothetical protein